MAQSSEKISYFWFVNSSRSHPPADPAVITRPVAVVLAEWRSSMAGSEADAGVDK
jgi:hypothetical protein